MTKARILADFVSSGNPLADGTISVSEVVGAAPLANPTFTGDLTAPEIDLTAIAKDISDTAVDVFVYDTSKDSDGGAWRKRTQATSWYNETLNTATRGSRKEFPAVAVIVADNDGLYIYDGDDPDLPMWMKANDVTTGMVLNGSNSNAVTAKNGIIALAGSSALWVMHFIDDRGDLRNSARRYDYKGNIEQRNDGLGYIDQETSGALVHHVVNDVAMTVLPNAPVDAATGLPVPTIAVSTAGGVSVISDTGSVYDITNSSSTYTASYHVSFDSKNNLWFHQGKTLLSYHGWVYVYSMPLSGDTAITINSQGATGQNPIALFQRHTGSGGSIQFRMDGGDSLIANTATGNDKGIGVFDLNTENQYASMAFQSTSDFNTGWQVGDSKLATLSDTDDTNVTGSELVTNGTFASNVSGWAGETDTTATYDSGRLKVTKTASSGPYGIVRTDVTTVVGKQYLFQADSITGSGPSAFFRFNDGALGAYTETEGTTHRAYFTATSTSTRVALGVASTIANAYIFWDNVSVRLAEEDRSVNGNGLQVFGTVTKTAVATGADLMRYDGWSGTNYLQQPYNSDLDFGTGDFSIIGWVKISNTTVNNIWFTRSNPVTASANRILCKVNLGKAEVQLGNVSFTGTSIVGDGTWNHCVFTRAGGTVSCFVNGVLETSGTSTIDTTDTSAETTIGVLNYNKALYFGSGSLALVRVSATAPSPEQIAKIYEDEKVLFQENAQATLYGSSDAVTALAYDDTTDLLHVGTSAGRSVFQGLRRVDNTTDAVGAAISASNGLVAED